MKDSLEQDFHIPVQWMEDQSRNTFENARFSAPILQRQNIHTIYLVTHALHMSRAREAFEHVGFHVIPAPTLFAVWDELTIFHFLPQGGALSMSTSLCYEALGRLWYAIK